MKPHKFFLSQLAVLTVLFFTIAGLKSYAATDTTWQEDYTYSLDQDKGIINLTNYNGEGGDIILPAKAVINGKEYKTYLGGGNYSHKDKITSFSAEKGVVLTSGSFLFADNKNIKKIDLSNIDSSSVTNMEYMFRDCFGLTSLDLSNLDTSNVTDMNSMFRGCSGLTSLDLSGLDTSNVTDMSCMFCDCKSLTSLDLSSFDTSNVTVMLNMFWDCSGLKSLNVRSFDTSNVTNMEAMFYNCSGLTSMDLSSFDTSSVKKMGQMFGGCSGLTNLELNHFDTSSVTEMGGMFSGCSGLTSLDLSHFDTSGVTKMNGMFGWCSGLTGLNISGFNTSNVKSMRGMFNHCISLRNLDLSDFDVSNVTDVYEMFYCSNNLMIIKTPKAFKASKPAQLSQTFYEEKDDGSLGEVGYTDLVKAPAGKVLVTKVAYLCEQNILSDKYFPAYYEDYSESPMIIDGKDMSWNESHAMSFWYENGIKQGTYWDPQGVLGEDPETKEKTIRGREICDNNIKDDNGNGTWFWLDSCYDGAKAVGKEVWVPYIYQQEDEWDDETKHNIAFESDEGMGDCVLNAIRNKAGKWVRYDEKGRMLKGWVTIEGTLAEIYPDQAGNTYYYDTRTGLMAKGWVTLNGQAYFFDEISGVLVP